MTDSAHRPSVASAASGAADKAPRPEARAQRLVFAGVAAVLAAVVAFAAWQALERRARASEPPLYGAVPPFTLVERSGATLRTDDLRGKVWIATFIFTRCGGVCPGLTAQLATLLRRRGASHPALTGVSFSVDPTNDTPPVLAAYASRFGADALPWLFLTGERAEVEHLVRDGFRLALAELPPDPRDPHAEPITHSDRLVLVDPALRIRGYYRSDDRAAMERLERDLALVDHGS